MCTVRVASVVTCEVSWCRDSWCRAPCVVRAVPGPAYIGSRARRASLAPVPQCAISPYLPYLPISPVPQVRGLPRHLRQWEMGGRRSFEAFHVADAAGRLAGVAPPPNKTLPMKFKEICQATLRSAVVV